MVRAARSTAEKMIKVDHAGENGAVNIYRAQGLAVRLRAPALIGSLAENQRHEMEHRRIFAAHLAASGVRRCVSYHFCGAGGFALGLVTGLLGPNAVAATTYAVEHVVLDHLETQLRHLADADPAAHDCVAQIIADEKAHHDAAAARLVRDRALTRGIIRIVAFSTECVIRFGMR